MLSVMTDETVTKPPTGTVGFEFKVPTGTDYCYAVGSIYLPFEANVDDADATNREAALAFNAGKRVVFDALGVEYESTFDDEGVEQVVALLEQTFGPGVVTKVVDQFNREVEQQADGQPAPRTGSVKLLKQLEQNGQKVPAPDWLDKQYDYYMGKADAPDTKERVVWDNRKFLPEFGGNGSEKAPWFRSTGKEGEPGAGVGIWPPKRKS